MKKAVFFLVILAVCFISCLSVWSANCTVSNCSTCMTGAADLLTIYETDDYSDIKTCFDNYLGPGDRIEFEAGGIFRWRYEIDHDMGGGTSSKRIIFTSDSSNRAVFDLGIYENWDQTDDLGESASTFGMDDYLGGNWGGGADMGAGGYTADRGTEDFEWCQSSRDSNSYFALKAGGNCSSFTEDDCPALQKPIGYGANVGGMLIEGTKRAEHVSLPLTSQTWGFFDVSSEASWAGSRAFKTIYVRLADNSDPDSCGSADCVAYRSQCPSSDPDGIHVASNDPAGVLEIRTPDDTDLGYITISNLIIRNGHGRTVEDGNSRSCFGLFIEPDIDDESSDSTDAVIVQNVLLDSNDSGAGTSSKSDASHGDDWIRFSECEFYDNGKYPQGSSTGQGHNIYSLGGSVHFEYCYFHRAKEGTHLKLPVRRAQIEYCWFQDSYGEFLEYGKNKYLGDQSVNNQTFTLVGCIIDDSLTTYLREENIRWRIHISGNTAGAFTRTLNLYYNTWRGRDPSTWDSWHYNTIELEDANSNLTANLVAYNNIWYNVDDDRYFTTPTEYGRWDSITYSNNWFTETSATDWNSGNSATWNQDINLNWINGGTNDPFVDKANGDYKLVTRGGAVSLGIVPISQYVKHADQETRTTADDVGAFAFDDNQSGLRAPQNLTIIPQAAD